MKLLLLLPLESCPLCKVPVEVTTHGTMWTKTRRVRFRCKKCQLTMEWGGVRWSIENLMQRMTESWNRRAEPSAWQPIELAVPDWRPMLGIDTLRHTDKDSHIYIIRRRPGRWICDGRTVFPTHYMPLPAAPKVS